MLASLLALRFVVRSDLIASIVAIKVATVKRKACTVVGSSLPPCCDWCRQGRYVINIWHCSRASNFEILVLIELQTRQNEKQGGELEMFRDMSRSNRKGQAF